VGWTQEDLDNRALAEDSNPVAWNFWEEERRRTLTAGEKKRLLLLAKGKCENCGMRLTEQGVGEDIHHIKPWAERGSDKDDNLIVLCPNCHRKVKVGTIPAEELKKKIAYRLDKPPKRVDARKTASVAKTTGKSSRRAAPKRTTATAKRRVGKPKSATGKTTKTASKSKVTKPRKRTAKKTIAKARKPSAVRTGKRK